MEKDFIDRYFTLFKNEQLLLIILGAVAFVAALVFYLGLKTPWYKGFALPMAVFALIFCSAGINNYSKTSALRIRAAYNSDMHPELLKSKELPRIREQKQNLRVLIYVNLSIIAASFLIFLYFQKKEGNEYYMGMAASLLLMATISVIIYYIMLGHSKEYSEGINKSTANIIVKEEKV